MELINPVCDWCLIPSALSRRAYEMHLRAEANRQFSVSLSPSSLTPTSLVL